MANRIQGITIELNGDTTKLEKSLKGVNGEVKSTQNALNDVKKLLKLDPTNIDLLRQRQKLLGNQIENTNNKLEALKKAQADMDAAGVDKSSAAYMALDREIIDNEISLKGLKKAAAQSNATLEQVAAVADKVADGANKVADATKGMSTAAAGALTALGGMAYKAVTGADELNTLAKQTGFSVEELQKFEYAADRVDVSVSDITGAAAKMKKAMASGSDAFDQLGVRITNVDGSMRDVNSVFYDVLGALSRIGNETERDQMAMQIFGKSADQLAGIVDDGGAALRSMGNEAESLGLIMSGDTLDGLNQVNDAIDQLKAQAKAQFAQTGAKVVQALLPIIAEVLTMLDRALNWLASLNTEQIRTLMTILAIVAAISPVASIIAAIAGAISALIPVILTMNAAIAANPAILVIAAIGAAIIALAVLVVASWDQIKAAFQAMVEKIKAGAEQIKSMVQAAFQAAVEAATALMHGVLSLAKGIANGVISMVEGAINSVINSLNGLIGMINSVAQALAGLVGMSFGGIGDIPTVNLPKFAKGGSLTSGAALVGEAGPELLTVAGGRATVTPLTASIDSKSLAALGAGGTQQTNVNIQFSGSLAQLAAVLQPAIAAETTRRGVSLIK